MSDTPCNRKDCDLINPINVGKENESMYCRTHHRAFWPNRAPSSTDRPICDCPCHNPAVYRPHKSGHACCDRAVTVDYRPQEDAPAGELPLCKCDGFWHVECPDGITRYISGIDETINAEVIAVLEGLKDHTQMFYFLNDPVTKYDAIQLKWLDAEIERRK